MDIITHALLGAISGVAITRARGNLRAAALAGAVTALFPDVDVLIDSAQDPLLVIEYHRQFTHSLLIAPLGALIAAGLLWLALRRRVSFAALYLPALVGFVSHIVLDSATSYGVQFLWPFSAERYAWSVVAVIDPVVTIVLIVALTAALRAKAARRAQLGLAAVALYLGLGWIQQERAENAIEVAAAARGHKVAEHVVKPTLANLFLWRSVYRTGEELVVDAVHVGVGRTVYRGGSVRRIRPIDLVPPLELNSVQANDVVRFAVASQGWLARYPRRPDVIGDVRYSKLPDSTLPLWAIEIQPERQEHHVRFHTFREFTREDRQRFFAMLRGAALDAK